jgi:tRNA(fMet)-specific endonuclease VapC
MDYLLDTTILVHIIRNSELFKLADKNLGFFIPTNRSFTSIVSAGEIKSFAYQNGWGQPRMFKLGALLNLLTPVHINNPIVEVYAEIDAFSQGKHPGKVSTFSPRNMGKNDLWIAATANILNASLVTTDNDFDHLHNEFIDLIKIT